MMRHKEIEELIQKSLDKEIVPEEEVILKNHFKKCSECHHFFEEMSRMVDEIRDLTEYFPSQDFNQRVLSKIRAKKHTLLPKLIPVFIGSYFATVLFLFLSPVAKLGLSKLLLSFSPIINGVLKTIRFVENFARPSILLIKTNFRFTEFAIGLVMFLFILFLFTKIFKKEEICVSS